MKSSIVFFLICRLCVLNGFSQNQLDYTAYHQKINQAEMFLFQEDIKASFNLYKEVFGQYQYGFRKDYFNGAILAALSTEETFSKNWLEQSFMLGLSIKEAYRNKILVKYLGKQQIETIYASAQSKNPTNAYFTDLVVKMFQEDQKIRKRPIVWSNIRTVDAKNLDTLKNIFQRIGYLSEYIIGRNDYKLSIMLLHNCDELLSEKTWEAFLKKQVIEGKMHPEWFAQTMDRYQLMASMGKERYYYLSLNYSGEKSVVGYKSLLEKDAETIKAQMKIIEERRSELGLKTVEQAQNLLNRAFVRKYGLMAYVGV